MIYRVNKIDFKLNTKNESLLKELKKYKIDTDLFTHYFIVNYLDEISSDVELSGANPFILKEEGYTNKYYYNQYGITCVIRHDNDYNDIYITLSKNLIKDLLEAEYIFLGLIFMEVAMSYGYLPIHASSLIYKDKAFLLSAPSGTGKSTLRNHLLNINKDIKIINDDKPLLEFDDDSIYTFGSPFSGEDKLNANTKKELTHIFFLAQGKANKVYELTDDEKTVEVLKNIYKPKLDDQWDVVLRQIDKLVSKVKIMKVEVVNDISAANFITDLLDKL